VDFPETITADGLIESPAPSIKKVVYPRGARAGEHIKLRARFKDELDKPAQATEVIVNIFPPGTGDFDLSNAETVSGVPVYLGGGIFEYDYHIPDTGPDGLWYDQWLGDLTYQQIEGLFNFEVTASGLVEQIPTQLRNNNFVHIIVASGIKALDGSVLADPLEIEWMTPIEPAFTTVRKVRLEIGGFIANVYDDTVSQAILEASLQANAMTWEKFRQQTEMYYHARREYATCLASRMILTNITAKHMLKSKTLADLSVAYDPTALGNALNQLDDCVQRWESQVLSGGQARKIQQPQLVVKGEYDPDKPIVSRMWMTNDMGDVSRRVPAANERMRPIGQRRFVRTYWPVEIGLRPRRRW
jgi:hypothetical protein